MGARDNYIHGLIKDKKGYRSGCGLGPAWFIYVIQMVGCDLDGSIIAEDLAKLEKGMDSAEAHHSPPIIEQRID